MSGIIIIIGPGGAQGATGHQGATGAQGVVGSQGPVGVQGVQGMTGAQGTNGEQGPQGTQGTQGGQGEQGAQGEQGGQGAQGDQGVQGVQGAQGAQGEGVQGITGPQGTEGAQGEQGAQGPAGVGNSCLIQFPPDVATALVTTCSGIVNEQAPLILANAVGQSNPFANPTNSTNQIIEGFNTTTGAYHRGLFNGVFLNTNPGGLYSTALGTNTIASGQNSFADGSGTRATGSNSVALGDSCNVSGVNSIACGISNNVSGSNSISVGQNNIVSGPSSAAFGLNTRAQGQASFSSGQGSVASGSNSVALGEMTTASGKDSMASGIGSNSYFDGSFANNTIDFSFVGSAGPQTIQFNMSGMFLNGTNTLFRVLSGSDTPISFPSNSNYNAIAQFSLVSTDILPVNFFNAQITISAKCIGGVYSVADNSNPMTNPYVNYISDTSVIPSIYLDTSNGFSLALTNNGSNPYTFIYATVIMTMATIIPVPV